MAEFKGTPGPWRYTTDQTGCVSAGGDILASVYPNCPHSEIDNVMGEWTGIHEMRANARLIAAAPALLEAALYMAKWDHCWPGNISLEQAAAKARAAIASALGEG